jgi:flagellar protein FlaJ
MERMPIWQIAIRRLEMSPVEYAFRYLVPAAVGGFLMGILVWLSLNSIFTGASGVILLFMCPALASIGVVMWPLIDTQRCAVAIEKEMHMFITRMGILSLGEGGARSMFDILRQMGDYGALAEEVKAIELLVEKWHTSLPEAARIVGRQSPSPIWGDFLDRLAFSVEAGQQIDDYMRAEQQTFQAEFETIYDTRLEAVDMLREIYISLTTTGMFMLVVAGIHLVLFMTGTPEDDFWSTMVRIRWVLLSAVGYAVMQVGGLISFIVLLPHEGLFGRHDFQTPIKVALRRAWIFGCSLGLILLGVIGITGLVYDLAWVFDQWDKYGMLIIAVIFTPLLAPAFIVSHEERKVNRRDTAYPGFIRALGGTAQARASEPVATIKALRGIDFGTLNDAIEHLEKRLALRVDSDLSWDWFTADANSMMIARFTRIYLEGSQASGKPADVAELVSANTTNLISLRQRRALSAGTMRGVAYGVLIAMIVCLNVTISVVSSLGGSVAGVAEGLQDNAAKSLPSMSGGFGVPVMDNPGSVSDNIFLFKMTVSILVLFMIVILGLISGRIRGGGWTISTGQFVAMLWIAGITSYATTMLLENTMTFFAAG